MQRRGRGSKKGTYLMMPTNKFMILDGVNNRRRRRGKEPKSQPCWWKVWSYKKHTFDPVLCSSWCEEGDAGADCCRQRQYQVESFPPGCAPGSMRSDSNRVPLVSLGAGFNFYAPRKAIWENIDGRCVHRYGETKRRPLTRVLHGFKLTAKIPLKILDGFCASICLSDPNCIGFTKYKGSAAATGDCKNCGSCELHGEGLTVHNGFGAAWRQVEGTMGDELNYVRVTKLNDDRITRDITCHKKSGQAYSSDQSCPDPDCMNEIGLD